MDQYIIQGYKKTCRNIGSTNDFSWHNYGQQ